MNEKQRENLKRGVLIALSVLMLVYLVYQVYMISHDSVKTETVQSVTVNDSVKTDVFVVRSEYYVTDKGDSSTTIPLVSDGNRVSKGGGVVAVFSDPKDASNYARTTRLSEELKRYNRLNSQNGSYAVNVQTMNSAISDDVIDLAEDVDSGDMEQVQDDIYNVRDTIITKQIATGESIDLNSKLTMLNQEYSALMQKSSRHSTINARSSGYYIDGYDGYEKTVNYSKVKDLTVKQVKKILKAKPVYPTGKTIGKVCSDFDWYMICVIPSNRAGVLAEGDEVTVNMPTSSVSSVPAKVAAMNTSGNKTAVILSSNWMNSSIAALRKESAELVMHSYTGLKVNVDAVDVNDKGEKGVYIKSGNMARFRKLDIIYSTDKYVISREHETGNYVSLYDNVFIGGNGLYDGKII